MVSSEKVWVIVGWNRQEHNISARAAYSTREDAEQHLKDKDRMWFDDEAAVIEALNSGALHAYVCDFPSTALKGHPRVMATPHLGASTGEAEDNCAVMVADQLRDFLETGNVRNSVNFPEAVMALLPGKTRLCIVNENVPNMVGQISTALAKRNINIADLLNKSRGDLAYTIVDTDQMVGPEVLGEIGAIHGVLSVRAIPARA